MTGFVCEIQFYLETPHTKSRKICMCRVDSFSFRTIRSYQLVLKKFSPPFFQGLALIGLVVSSSGIRTDPTNLYCFLFGLFSRHLHLQDWFFLIRDFELMLLIFIVFSTIFLQGLILIGLILSLLGLILILLIFTEHHKLFNACLFYLPAVVY